MLKKSLLAGLLILSTQNMIANNDLAMLEAAEETALNTEKTAQTLDELAPYIKTAAAVIIVRFGLDLIQMAYPSVKEATNSIKTAVAPKTFIVTKS